MSEGRVRAWHADKGWGVLDSEDTPGGCWVHMSHFHAEARRELGPGSYSIGGGFHHLTVGETVDFDWEPVPDQDGYTFRAIAVRPRRPTPPWTLRRVPDDGAYATSLEITFEGTDHDEMTVAPTSHESPAWTVAIAESLEGYLREAAALPPPAPSVESPGQTGWFALAPGSPPVGRTPWIHMTDIAATAVGETIIVRFRWKLDGTDSAPTYLLPLTTMKDDDPITGSAGLITYLDGFLDTPTWRASAHPIGHRTSIAILPPATRNRPADS